MARFMGGFIFVGAAVLALLVGWWTQPVWLVESSSLAVQKSDDGTYVQMVQGKPRTLDGWITPQDSLLLGSLRQRLTEPPAVETETIRLDDSTFTEVVVKTHWGIFSLLPAATAVLLCFLLREPVIALSGGVIAGGLLMGLYDLPGQVLVPALATSTGATIVVLYLWFLGGMMGVWSRNGAALAFAEWVTCHFVRGPRGAKLVTWLLGVSFFQGGTVSTVLVGTTVRPVADREKVSHEELSYVVDSTAAPIAVLLPFNAWPVYVQAFIFVAGVPILATEGSRIAFFFQCIPLYFYAILAVGFTFLLCFDKLPFVGKSFQKAINRSRTTGALDRPGAEPLLAGELEEASPPDTYRPSVWEFIIPIALIIGITVSTFFFMGSPQVLWGFGTALVVSMVMTLLRGMSLSDLMQGLQKGLRGVVYGSVILLMAVVVGGISRDAGAGVFLVEILGDAIPPVVLPLSLVILTMIISFSTGTSWGTFAVSLPIAMPLAWAVAQAGSVDNPVFFLSICFAAVINGSIFGDQCSPISDTTVLSCVSTGCDLMDHVRTQIVPCSIAMAISILLWTLLAALA